MATITDKRHFPDPSILLHPQIPKPLHLLNPRTVMGKEWWDEHRQVAYAEHNYCCHACGIHKLMAAHHSWLEAHEMYNIDYSTGKVEFVELVALCHSCHNYIHKGRMLMILGNDDMPQDKYDAIIAHGDKLLKDNRLKLIAHTEHCNWGDWHLIIDGKNYGQRFHSYDEWLSYWQR